MKFNGMPTSGITTEYLRSLALVVWQQLLVRCQQIKATSKGGGSGTKGKRSGNNASRGEGLIYHIISLNLRSLMVEMTIQT